MADIAITILLLVNAAWMYLYALVAVNIDDRNTLGFLFVFGSLNLMAGICMLR